MRALISIILLLLISCSTEKLPDNWAPITTMIERNDIPGVSNTAITTVSPYLIVNSINRFWKSYPKGSAKLEALRQHEIIHAIRQEIYYGGKVNWLRKYVFDKDFRWAEEKAGYKAEITHLVKKGQWWNGRTESRAKTLSGKAYLNMTTYEEAKSWVEQVVRDARKPS